MYSSARVFRDVIGNGQRPVGAVAQGVHVAWRDFFAVEVLNLWKVMSWRREESKKKGEVVRKRTRE